jgi:hypothetical protein
MTIEPNFFPTFAVGTTTVPPFYTDPVLAYLPEAEA